MKVEKSSRLNFQLFGLIVVFSMFLVSFRMSGIQERDRVIPLDKVIHTISGAGLALAFAPFFKKKTSLIVLVLIAGMAFEVAEFFSVPFGFYGEVDRYIIDTVLDLAVAVLGGIIAAQLLRTERRA